jgi:hypothetical protein
MLKSKMVLRDRTVVHTHHDIKVRVITSQRKYNYEKAESELIHHSKVDIPALDVEDGMRIADAMKQVHWDHNKSSDITRNVDVFVRVYMHQYSMGYADFPVDQMAGIIGLLDKVYNEVGRTKSKLPSTVKATVASSTTVPPTKYEDEDNE